MTTYCLAQSTTQVPTKASPEDSVGFEMPGDVTLTHRQSQNFSQAPGSPLKHKYLPAKLKKPTKKNANQIH